MHNKTLLTIRTEADRIYPNSRYVNGSSYSKSQRSITKAFNDPECLNAQMIYYADMNRLWLYLDLAGLEAKTRAINWFRVYTSIDFLQFQAALNTVYEIVRRSHLARLRLSQFKAEVRDQTGFPASLLLAPIWSQVETFFLSKEKETWASTVKVMVQWCRANHKLRLKLSDQTENAFNKFDANDRRLSALWEVRDDQREYYCSLIKAKIETWIPDRSVSIDYPHMSSGASAISDTHRNITLKLYYADDQNDCLLQYYRKKFNLPSIRTDLRYAVRLDSNIDIRTARFLTVDKNLIEGRGIGPQNPSIMWYQQGTKEFFYEGFFRSPFAKVHFPIFDRTVNQRWAIRGSIDNTIATVDLSSASDSVATPLIKRVFGPNLRCALLCARSKRFDLSSQDFTTYATMGDASTFPVETIIIGAAISCAIDLAVEYYRNRWVRLPFNPEDWSDFGDDIVCPNDPLVLRYLHDILTRIGFKINDDKSFLYGPYRESCGVEAYLGVQVEPMYFRPHLNSKASLVSSLIHICNAYYEMGYKSSRQFWLSELANILGRSKIPFTENPLDGSRVYTPNIQVSSLKTRYNRDTQELEIVSWVTRSPLNDLATCTLNGAYGLYQWLHKRRERNRKLLTLYLGYHQDAVDIRNHHDYLLSICVNDAEETIYDERRVKLSLRAVPVRLLVRDP